MQTYIKHVWYEIKSLWNTFNAPLTTREINFPLKLMKATFQYMKNADFKVKWMQIKQTYSSCDCPFFASLWPMLLLQTLWGKYTLCTWMKSLETGTVWRTQQCQSQNLSSEHVKLTSLESNENDTFQVITSTSSNTTHIKSLPS